MLQRRPACANLLAIRPSKGPPGAAMGVVGLLLFAAMSLPAAAQERTLWKPVHKTGFREVSTTIVSPTSSELPAAPGGATARAASNGGVLFTDPFLEPLTGPNLFEGAGSFETPLWDAPIGAIETTNDEFDYWLVDARSAPVTGDLRCGLAKLRFWHFAAGRWCEYSQAEFIAAMDPSLPLLFYVHGYGLGAPAAAYSTVRYACHISRNSRKFRIVTWAWGSRHNWLESPWENVQDKAWKSEVQGYYLAHLLGRLSPDTEVALVGHSFGCRAVCASLQGLATGTICRLPVTRTHLPRHPYEATLIAAGVESNALAPGQRYCQALSQVHRLNITTNAQDRVLLLLEFVTSNPRIMGLHGPECRDLPIEEAAKVRVHDVGWSVWGGHRMGRYTWTNATVPALTPSILGVFSPEGGGLPYFSLPW